MLHELVCQIWIFDRGIRLLGVIAVGAAGAWIVVGALMDQASFLLEMPNVPMSGEFFAHISLSSIDLGHREVVACRGPMLAGLRIPVDDRALGWVDRVQQRASVGDSVRAERPFANRNSEAARTTKLSRHWFQERAGRHYPRAGPQGSTDSAFVDAS